MPPPAPPSIPLNPSEDLKLRQYRQELDYLSDQKRIKGVLRQKGIDLKIERTRTHRRLFELLGGRTEAEIGRLAGLPRQTISLVLTGEREPKISTFLKIRQALGVPAADFYRYLVAAWKAPLNRPQAQAA